MILSWTVFKTYTPTTCIIEEQLCHCYCATKTEHFKGRLCPSVMRQLIYYPKTWHFVKCFWIFMESINCYKILSWNVALKWIDVSKPEPINMNCYLIYSLDNNMKYTPFCNHTSSKFGAILMEVLTLNRRNSCSHHFPLV